MSARRPYWPWGVGLDKRQARRLRRRLGRANAEIEQRIDRAATVFGVTLLPWQREVLRAHLRAPHRNSHRLVYAGGRQGGRAITLQIFDEVERLTSATLPTPTQGETR